MYDPTWPRYPPRYALDDIPIPPPPPPRGKRSYKVLVIAIIALLLAVGVSVVGIVYAQQHPNTSVPAKGLMTTPLTDFAKATTTQQVIQATRQPAQQAKQEPTQQPIVIHVPTPTPISTQAPTPIPIPTSPPTPTPIPTNATAPYTAWGIFKDFYYAGIKMGQEYWDTNWKGWSYRPEGKALYWRDTASGYTVEIATFATPNEAYADAQEVGQGYASQTVNNCLFMNDSSITAKQLSSYEQVMQTYCT